MILLPDTLRAVIKRLFHQPVFPFVLVFIWKLALFLFTAQPVPSDDAFFYDGPVVNVLLQGQYINPSLELALPISSHEVFSAYPPLYQVLLLGWMTVFGISAIAAMVLHLTLFGLFLCVLFAIFRRLSLPVRAVQVAACFLLVITFHDRPDSLAHLFGLAAIYSWIRSRRPSASDSEPPSRAWLWLAVAFTTLSLAAGLQVGGVYFLAIVTGMLATSLLARERFPTTPFLGLILIPACLVAFVALGFPHLWAGFLEHARQTPSFTGLRAPRATEILKMVRTVPGILAVAALLPWWIGQLPPARKAGQESLWLLTLACTLSALVIIAASMFLLLPQSVSFASYLQPLVVACYLTLVMAPSGRLAASSMNLAREFPLTSTPLPEEREVGRVQRQLRSLARSGVRALPPPPLARLQVWGFVILAALGSIRAVGMSTWGLACAADVGYPAVLQRIRSELSACPPHSIVVASSAYLYEVIRHRNVRPIHADWLAPGQRTGPNNDLAALVALKPSKLILTQFDFYRRYEPTLAALKSNPGLRELALLNTARVRPPDSFPSLQKVVQHISWAPVIVTLAWN